MKLDPTPQQDEAFAELFREARKATGFTQTDVSEVTGVHRTIISQLEHAAFPGMRFVDISRLCSAYGISLDRVAHVLGLM